MIRSNQVPLQDDLFFCDHVLVQLRETIKFSWNYIKLGLVSQLARQRGTLNEKEQLLMSAASDISDKSVATGSRLGVDLIVKFMEV